MKKVISILLIMCMVLASLTFASAASSTVSRGQLASLLVEASSYQDEAKGSAMFNVFSDVGKTTTYAQQIYIASRQGWMLGYTDGSFRPNNSVKLEEVCCAVLKYTGFNSKELRGAFPDAYVAKAKAMGYLDGVSCEQGELISLSECKLILKNAGVGDYKVSGSYVGILQSVTKNINSDDASVEGVYSVVCTDGETRSFTTSSYVEYKTGVLVRADVTSSKTTIKKIDSISITGKINSAVTVLGNYKIADEIDVLEADSYGNAKAIDKDLLAGITLSEDDVLYYTLNAKGEVDSLIILDKTGSLYSYGICTSAVISEGQNLSSSYTYIVNGRTQSAQIQNVAYLVENGGIAIKTYNNAVKSMYQLKEIEVDSISETKAVSGYSSYKVADDVQVYVKNGDTYYLSSMDALESSDYSDITAFADTKGIGLVRIVIANY